MSDRRNEPDRRSLSGRQEEIAHLLTTYSFREIGDQLGIAERTIKYHVDRMRLIFRVRNKHELIRILKKEGYIE